ncbi:[Pyruvate dehydrogenase (acetyl-transferring)] kinase mitochondrial [Zea mays]|uniref:[Pyruvate dehydrogenase (Acetyl-transferring)] kinase mitochondrial n=1 Tax=Zea mays TaxID=4577 RepID=A0A1D6PI18_MAIZE|nr:[Pyruvate dehydrogenase (acetyl-transferring)] kinase mitochondrial [Zea mays]
MINMVKVRHNNVVPTMALGVQQLKKELGRSRKVPFEFDEIHEFLDRFYMSRIGIHMLIGQHVALHDPKPEPGVIGIINTRLSPIQVAQAACEDACSVCLREYVSTPDINIYGDPNFTFPLAMKVAGYQEAASQEFFTYLYSTAKNPPELDRPNTEGRMAFKSTVNRTHLRLVREVEAIGGNVSASASREQMSYTYDALKSYTPEMVEVLIDNVRNPAFLDWEVKEQIRSFVHMANDAFGRRVAKLLGDVFHVLLLVLLKTPMSVVTKTIPRNHFLSSSTGCLSSCSKTIAVLQVVAAAPTPASAIGFEGYEKRLEISFYEAPVFADPNGRGFLFVYPYKILIKTCGTTKLLLGILRILELAKELSLPLVAAKYSRGTFIFPDAQPSPHKNFDDEVTFLNHFFDGLSISRSGTSTMPPLSTPKELVVTLEMCMTRLDKKRAYVFFKTSIDGYTSCAKDMTKPSVIVIAFYLLFLLNSSFKTKNIFKNLTRSQASTMSRLACMICAYYSRESARCLLNLVEVEYNYDADIDLVFIDLPVLEQERYRWTLEIVV